MATKQNDTKVVTGEVRLSYVHLFEPYAAGEDDDAKYSCVILIPKKDKKTLKRINAAIEAAAEAGKHSRFDGKIPKNLVTTLHVELRHCLWTSRSHGVVERGVKRVGGLEDKHIPKFLALLED